MAMTTDQAKQWLEENESKSPADISWIELQEAITALKMIVASSAADPYGKPYLDRALAIAHAKAQPYVMNARAGDTSEETIDQLTQAARTVRASANQRGNLAEIDQQFLTEVGRVLSSNQSAARGRRRGMTAGTAEVEETRAESRRLEEQFMAAAARAGIDEFTAQMDWATIGAQASTQGISIEEAIDAKIAEYEVMALEAMGPAIGPTGNLPFGFEAVRTDPTQAATEGLQMQRDRQGRQGPNRSTTVPARFFQGDELNPAGWSEERRAALQEQMVSAGLLDADSYYVGMWDENSIGAYKTILGYSNLWGTDPEETLNRLQAALPEALKDGRTDSAAQQRVARVYVKPDYASIAQEVKQTFERRLGRRPRDQELNELAGALSGFYRAQFDAQVAADDAAFAEEERAEAAGETPGNITQQGVDPIARFQQLFDQRYQPEEDRLEGIDDTRENMTNVFASLRTMGNMVGQ